MSRGRRHRWPLRDGRRSQRQLAIAPLPVVVVASLLVATGLLARAALRGATLRAIAGVCVDALVAIVLAIVLAVVLAVGTIFALGMVFAMPVLVAAGVVVVFVLTGRGVPPFAPPAPAAACA